MFVLKKRTKLKNLFIYFALSFNNFYCQYPLLAYPVSVFTPILELVQLRKFALIKQLHIISISLMTNICGDTWRIEELISVKTLLLAFLPIVTTKSEEVKTNWEQIHFVF